jgi:hypothetical protein
MKGSRMKIINKKHKDWNWKTKKKNDRHVISLEEKEKQEE